MADRLEEYTENEIGKLIDEFSVYYQYAEKVIQKSINDYLRQFIELEQSLRIDLANNLITIDEYNAILGKQVFNIKKWTKQKRKMAELLYEINSACNDMTNDILERLYMDSYNLTIYNTEMHYHREVGEELMTPKRLKKEKKENDLVIPKKRLKKKKDMSWNTKRIQSSVKHSIYLGGNLFAIGKRIVKVAVNRNFKSTSDAMGYIMRGTSEMAKYNSMVQLKREGVAVRKQWVATFDQRTRDTHRSLDHQIRELEEDFSVNGTKGRKGQKRIITYFIKFPREPKAPPEMICNCRCSIKYLLGDYPEQLPMRRENILTDENGKIVERKYETYYDTDGSKKRRLTQEWRDSKRRIIPDMTYEEWIEWRREQGYDDIE